MLCSIKTCFKLNLFSCRNFFFHKIPLGYSYDKTGQLNKTQFQRETFPRMMDIH